MPDDSSTARNCSAESPAARRRSDDSRQEGVKTAWQEESCKFQHCRSGSWPCPQDSRVCAGVHCGRSKRVRRRSGACRAEAVSRTTARAPTYRFTMEYDNADANGDTLLRQRLTGEYTRGLPDGKVEWNSVAQAEAIGATSSFSAAKKRDFMAPFRYVNRLSDTMKPEFFSTFPPMAMPERNLVWDTGMIEYLGQEFFDRLELNTPFHVAAHSSTWPESALSRIATSCSSGLDVRSATERIARSSTTRHFSTRCTSSSRASRCRHAVNTGVRSRVALGSKQIEYATLHETVVGQMQLGGQPQPQLVNVFRSGVLEPIRAR